MNLMPADLRALEESLWREQTRFDRGYMERILTDDFLEFGRSGRRYDRAAILALPAGSIATSLRDLEVRMLGADVALVTYVTESAYDDTVERANRASVWVRRDGNWRLQFHQGTPA
jgi:hypothetical protein